jgi:hypothetical protein
MCAVYLALLPGAGKYHYFIQCQILGMNRREIALLTSIPENISFNDLLGLLSLLNVVFIYLLFLLSFH